jgi:hypothetical protein
VEARLGAGRRKDKVEMKEGVVVILHLPHLSSSHLIFIFPSHLSPSPSSGAKGEQRPTGVRGCPSRRGGRGPPYAGRARAVADVCVAVLV